ncbi:hypothetical protein OIV83_000972 [Microbotryomycetes sp. JL201]|nr:hypothetical protein OIV83_000972 [Microbotryomycetes sp. JL201]
MTAVTHKSGTSKLAAAGRARLLDRRSSSLDAGLSALKHRQQSSDSGTDSSLIMYDDEDKGPGAGWSGWSAAAGLRGWHSGLTKSHASAVPPSPFLGWTIPIPQSRRTRKKLILRLITAALAVFVLGLLGGISLLDDRFGVKSTLEEFGIALNPSSCANPFAELGRLRVDQSNPDNNKWIPYDPKCGSLPLMARLRQVTRPKADQPLALPLPKRRRMRDPSKMPMPWLHGKTVLLYGDQVERQHNRDFCHFAGGKFAGIHPDHPMSPPRFVNGIDEKVIRSNQSTPFEGSRPAVCYVEQYDFMVVSAFHYGLANRVEFERGPLLADEHFHPPLALEDRLDHIVAPLLRSLGRTPDLIEFASGFWDLRHFASSDRAMGLDVTSDLTDDRLEWYSTRFVRALSDLGRTFPDTPILWRSMLHTPKFQDTPYSRVAALDQLGRQIIRQLDKSGKANFGDDSGLARTTSLRAAASGWSSRSTRRRISPRGLYMPGKKSSGGSGLSVQARHDASQVQFLRQVKARIGERNDHLMANSIRKSSDRASLKNRLSVDEWGHLMLSQQHLIEDINTAPLPGGYLWGDMMLFELRRR